MRRHEDTWDGRLAGHCTGVHRTGAAEGHQCEAARVEALLHGDHPDGAEHVGVGDRDDAGGGFLEAQTERPRHLALHSRPSRGRIEGQVTTQDRVVTEDADDQVGVRDCRQRAAAAVARRTGLCAGALWADLEPTGGIHAGDAAAAGADRLDVDHRRAQRVALDLLQVRAARFAADHGRDVATGAAHVERHEVRESGGQAEERAADNAADGTGEDRVDRPLLGSGGRHEASRGGHHVQPGSKTGIRQPTLETVDVGKHRPDDVGVDDGRAHPPVLTVLRTDVRRERDHRLRKHLGRQLGQSTFVRRVHEAEQKADGERVHTLGG